MGHRFSGNYGVASRLIQDNRSGAKDRDKRPDFLYSQLAQWSGARGTGPLCFYEYFQIEYSCKSIHFLHRYAVILVSFIPRNR